MNGSDLAPGGTQRNVRNRPTKLHCRRRQLMTAHIPDSHSFGPTTNFWLGDVGVFHYCEKVSSVVAKSAHGQPKHFWISMASAAFTAKVPNTCGVIRTFSNEIRGVWTKSNIVQRAGVLN